MTMTKKKPETRRTPLHPQSTIVGFPIARLPVMPQLIVERAGGQVGSVYDIRGWPCIAAANSPGLPYLDPE